MSEDVENDDLVVRLRRSQKGAFGGLGNPFAGKCADEIERLRAREEKLIACLDARGAWDIADPAIGMSQRTLPPWLTIEPSSEWGMICNVCCAGSAKEPADLRLRITHPNGAIFFGLHARCVEGMPSPDIRPTLAKLCTWPDCNADADYYSERCPEHENGRVGVAETADSKGGDHE